MQKKNHTKNEHKRSSSLRSDGVVLATLVGSAGLVGAKYHHNQESKRAGLQNEIDTLKEEQDRQTLEVDEYKDYIENEENERENYTNQDNEQKRQLIENIKKVNDKAITLHQKNIAIENQLQTLQEKLKSTNTKLMQAENKVLQTNTQLQHINKKLAATEKKILALSPKNPDKHPETKPEQEPQNDPKNIPPPEKFHVIGTSIDNTLYLIFEKKKNYSDGDLGIIKTQLPKLLGKDPKNVSILFLYHKDTPTNLVNEIGAMSHTYTDTNDREQTLNPLSDYIKIMAFPIKEEELFVKKKELTPELFDPMIEALKDIKPKYYQPPPLSPSNEDKDEEGSPAAAEDDNKEAQSKA